LWRWEVLGGKTETVILSPGLDGSNLRSLFTKGLDDGQGSVVLVNCGVERLTCFDKVGMADYLDAYLPAYTLLKRAANGFIFHAFPSPWQLHVVRNGQMGLLETSDKRPAFVDAERKIKNAPST
jgi:hypothetical protein